MSAPDARFGTWAIHYQESWRDDAANPHFSKALRVAFLAYGNHRANGHANFAQQEIAKTLGKVDEHGTFVPADRRAVHRAIQQAVDWGLLAEGSRALCLIVPKHRVAGGPGEDEEPCRRHPEHSSTGRRGALRVVQG